MNEAQYRAAYVDDEVIGAYQLRLINEHREALGYAPFTALTQPELELHAELIEAHAPYGNDPWDFGADYDPGVKEARA